MDCRTRSAQCSVHVFDAEAMNVEKQGLLHPEGSCWELPQRAWDAERVRASLLRREGAFSDWRASATTQWPPRGRPSLAFFLLGWWSGRSTALPLGA